MAVNSKIMHWPSFVTQIMASSSNALIDSDDELFRLEKV
jgi:hypothetical protein